MKAFSVSTQVTSSSIWEWEIKWSVHWFDCDESLTWWGLNSNPGPFRSFYLYLCSLGELRLLVSWCACGRCGMPCSDEDRGRSRRLGAEDWRWSHISGTQWPGDREVRWSWGDEESEFLGWASKSRATVCQWFDLKTTGIVCQWFDLKTTETIFSSLASKPVVTVFSGLTSKPVATISDGFALKSAATVSSGLALKPVVTVSPGLTLKPVVDFLVEPQNRGGWWFPGLSLKTVSFSLVIWDSKSPWRFLGLDLKTKWTLVCRLRHKTDGGRLAWDTRRDLAACFTWKQVRLGFSSLPSRLAEVWRRVGAHDTITEVASESSRRRTGRCDRLRQILLPLFCRFCCISP
jgi:hypothetical protein